MSYDSLRRRNVPHLANLEGYSGLEDAGSDEEFQVDSSIPSTPFDLCDSDQHEHLESKRAKEHRLSRSSSLDADQAEFTPKGTSTPRQTDGDVDDRQCRICFSGPEEEESLGG